MKYLKLFIFCLLLTTSLHSQDIPTFKDVVYNFYNTYSFTSIETFPKFFKKKEGWFIAEDNYSNPGNLVNQNLFWSAKEKRFLELNYPDSRNDSLSPSIRVEKYLKLIDWNYYEYLFSRIKYYGYPGWDWDIINEPIDKNKMTDTLWEAVARANSNYAAGFLFDQVKDVFQNGDTDRIILKDYEKISKSRTGKFITYVNNAIDAYKEIIKINPSYETKVGNIKLKCANEYIFAYSDLMMAGDTLNAKKFLVGVDYPDSILNLSKLYLDATPKNGILFTGGDNDTYPLWYLQQAENYRSDVLVLNTNLLGLRRYVKMIDTQHNGTLFTTKDSVYYKNNFDYFLYNKSKENTSSMEVGQFILALNSIGDNLKSEAESVIYKNEAIKQYESNQLYFISLDPERSSGIITKVAKMVQLNDYIFMEDFMLLDIINSNLNKRPIYFTYLNSFLKNILELQESLYKIETNN